MVRTDRYDNLFKKIGEDVRIHQWCEITQPELVEIENHVSIDGYVYFSVSAELGSYIHIGNGVSVLGGPTGELIMEDFTNIGSGSKIVVISDDFTKGLINPIVPLKYRNLIGNKIIMRRFSLVGVNSVVLPYVEMAEGSVLAANSLLKKSTEQWCIYGGSPARKIGERDKELILKGAKELGYCY